MKNLPEILANTCTKILQYNIVGVFLTQERVKYCQKQDLNCRFPRPCTSKIFNTQDKRSS